MKFKFPKIKGVRPDFKGTPMAYHFSLIVFKIFFILNEIFAVSNGIGRESLSGLETFDILYHMMLLILIGLSATFHHYKKGVYLLYAYWFLDLASYFIISAITYFTVGQWSVPGTQLFSYSVFTIFLLVVTFNYYKSRMELLK